MYPKDRKCQGTCICHNDKTNGYWYGFDCSKCLGEQNSKTKGYTGANCNISCENNYCNNHGQCLGEQTCTCDNKYTGDTCNKCMDNVIDEKGDGSLCQTCKDGFTGENCEINCDNVNYCNNKGICQDSECVCNDNYRGEFCDIDCREEDSNGINYCNNNGTCKVYVSKEDIQENNVMKLLIKIIIFKKIFIFFLYIVNFYIYV